MSAAGYLAIAVERRQHALVPEILTPRLELLWSLTDRPDHTLPASPSTRFAARETLRIEIKGRDVYSNRMHQHKELCNRGRHTIHAGGSQWKPLKGRGTSNVCRAFSRERSLTTRTTGGCSAKTARGATEVKEDVRALTPLIYGHVTPCGTFRFDMNSRLLLE